MSFAGYPHASGSKQRKSVGKLDGFMGLASLRKYTDTSYIFIHLKIQNGSKEKSDQQSDRLPTVFAGTTSLFIVSGVATWDLREKKHY